MAQLSTQSRSPSSWAEIASLFVLVPAMLWNALWFLALLPFAGGTPGLIAVMLWGIGAAFLALPAALAFGVTMGGWARGASTAARAGVASGMVALASALAIIIVAIAGL